MYNQNQQPAYYNGQSNPLSYSFNNAQPNNSSFPEYAQPNPYNQQPATYYNQPNCTHHVIQMTTMTMWHLTSFNIRTKTRMMSQKLASETKPDKGLL